MATLPGVPVTASRYHDYMILYTVGEGCSAVVDGAPPGPMGRLFTVPPHIATKVPYEAGRFLLQHKAYTGVVRVNETEKEDGSGTLRDIDTAKAESAALLHTEDARRWRDYITYIIEDKLNNKKVVPPTPDAILSVMERNPDFRLEHYGINIQGQAPASASGDVAELKKLVQAQAKQIADLTATLNDAIGGPPKRK